MCALHDHEDLVTWFPRQLAWASETVLESDELARGWGNDGETPGTQD